MFCLFGVYRPMHSRIVHSYGNAAIASEGLQMLTYARHSWPLSWKGYLRATPTVTRAYTLYNGHLWEPWHTRCRAFVNRAVTTLFLRLRSVAKGDRSSISFKWGVRSTSTTFRLHLKWLSPKRFKSHRFQMNIWCFITKKMSLSSNRKIWRVN